MEDGTERKVPKDYKVSLCMTIEEADMVLGALADRVLRTENLRQFVYESVNEQVSMYTSFKENENKKVESSKGRKNK